MNIMHQSSKMPVLVSGMKKFINWLIDNRGMSWATMLIVIAQGFHYYHLFIGIELFKDYLSNVIYALFLTVVLSMPLMIFTTKLGSLRKNKQKLFEFEDRKNIYITAIAWYTTIDIIVNIYTWYNKLDVFFSFDWQFLPKYIVVTCIAVLLPITLKKFAGEIK